MRKLSFDEFVKKSKLIHGDKFDYSKAVYKNNQHKVELICNFCKNIIYVTPANHMHGHQCKYCSKQQQSSKRSLKHEEFLRRATEIHGDKFEYLEICKGYKKFIQIKCKDCGEIFKQIVYSHLRGNGCAKCAYRNKPQNKHFSPEKFEQLAKIVHCGLYEYTGDYKGYAYKVSIICKKHGVFKQEANAHLKGQGCPECSLSWGELEISLFLTEYNILYETQKKFEDCKSKKTLYFDFYIPSKNICIEYDGEQHFYPIKWFGGLKAFKEIKIRDNIKTKYCIDNGICLIRIPYYSYEKIKDILYERVIK